MSPLLAMVIQGSEFHQIMEKGANMSEVTRKEPPSTEANNTDIFVWALYVLGGANKQVDVEDIYFKAYELAPLRFGWRTRPEIPNFKKTAKALQEIEAKSHVGLLQKLGANYRRLTPAGVQWIETYKPLLERTYAAPESVAAPANSDLTRRIREIKTSDAWLSWVNNGGLKINSIAKLLNCSLASSSSIWANRLADLAQTAKLSNDEQLRTFTQAVQAAYSKGIN